MPNPSFVENVNQLATKLTTQLATDITALGQVLPELNTMYNAYENGEFPLINDVVPNTTEVYSSSKVQSMHNAQEQAIANLSSASGSLASSAQLVLTTSNQNLSFTPQVATTNINLFEVQTNQFVFKANGVYNFLSSVFVLLSTGQTRTITFEVYDVNSGLVLSSNVGSLNGANGDIVSMQLNTLINLTTVPVSGSITAKVRARINTSNDVTVQSFSSTLVLSGASGGGQLLGTKPLKGVMYLSNTVDENIVVPDGANAIVVSPTVTGSITVPNGSTMVIL